MYPEDVEAFVCPNGYSLSVRMPLGSFRTNRVIRPGHSTEFLYTVMEKRLFLQLKKHRTSDFNLRVPTDLKIYADAKRTKYVSKSSKKSVIEYFEGNSRIYVWSDYVMDLLDLEKTQQIELDKSKPKEETIKKEEIKVKKKLPPTTADAALERLLTLGVPIVLPPRPPFPGIDQEAHKWSIPMVISYVEDELELPMYKDAFQGHEINGCKFICLNQNQLIKEMEIDQNMHAFKIAAYVTKLREKVFETSALNKPKDIYDWQPEHLAGWLHYSIGHPNAAYCFFKARMTISSIRASDVSTVFSKVSPLGVEEEEFNRAAEAIKKLIDDRKLEDQRLEEKRLQEEKAKKAGMGDHLKNNKKDKVNDKRETAMKRRKLQEDTDDDNDENKDSNKLVESTNVEHIDAPIEESGEPIEPKPTKKKTKVKKSKHRQEINADENNMVEEPKAADVVPDPTIVIDQASVEIEAEVIDDVVEDDIKKKKKKKGKAKSRNNDVDMNELVLEVSSTFRQKISMLEKVVSDQSKSVEELRLFAEKLKKDKEDADENARKLGMSFFLLLLFQ